MKRTLYKQLLHWKGSSKRKPLMLYGARQVGKTYLLKEFGHKEYSKLVYINCYQNTAVRTLFSEGTDVNNILLGLSAISGIKIEEENTLLFLDEVQDIPQVVAALKYFQEDAPNVHVVAAGSLLGVLNMHGHSFPTGKVNFLHLYPMSFEEFLEAKNEKEALKILQDPERHELVNSLLPKYIDLLRQYYFVGGMPEAVLEYIDTEDVQAVRTIQNNILMAYEADIAKHAGSDTQKARAIFQSIPAQLARENKKFVFSDIKKGARYSEYENAIQWLIDAGLIYKVSRVSKVAIPLSFYIQDNVFKLFLLDVGLLAAMAQIPPSMMLIGNNSFSEFKGAFTENYVLTQLMACGCDSIAYYSKDNSSLEIDFIVQTGTGILPIEVKAEVNVKSKSLRQFVTVDQAENNLHGYRFSMLGYEHQDWMSNIPLPAVYSFINTLK